MRFGSHYTALLVALVVACTPTAVTQSPAATPPPTAAPEPTPVREAAPAKPTVPVTVRDAADDAKWNAIAANHTIAKKVVIGRYASVRFEPDSLWSLLIGAGSGLPLSRARAPGAESESVLAVTSPAFRGIVSARYTLPSPF